MSQEEHPTDVRLHMTRAMGKKIKALKIKAFTMEQTGGEPVSESLSPVLLLS